MPKLRIPFLSRPEQNGSEGPIALLPSAIFRHDGQIDKERWEAEKLFDLIAHPRSLRSGPVRVRSFSGLGEGSGWNAIAYHSSSKDVEGKALDLVRAVQRMNKINQDLKPKDRIENPYITILLRRFLQSNEEVQAHFDQLRARVNEYQATFIDHYIRWHYPGGLGSTKTVGHDCLIWGDSKLLVPNYEGVETAAQWGTFVTGAWLTSVLQSVLHGRPMDHTKLPPDALKGRDPIRWAAPNKRNYVWFRTHYYDKTLQKAVVALEGPVNKDNIAQLLSMGDLAVKPETVYTAGPDGQERGLMYANARLRVFIDTDDPRNPDVASVVDSAPSGWRLCQDHEVKWSFWTFVPGHPWVTTSHPHSINRPSYVMGTMANSIIDPGDVKAQMPIGRLGGAGVALERKETHPTTFWVGKSKEGGKSTSAGAQALAFEQNIIWWNENPEPNAGPRHWVPRCSNYSQPIKVVEWPDASDVVSRPDWIIDNLVSDRFVHRAEVDHDVDLPSIEKLMQMRDKSLTDLLERKFGKKLRLFLQEMIHELVTEDAQAFFDDLFEEMFSKGRSMMPVMIDKRNRTLASMYWIREGLRISNPKAKAWGEYSGEYTLHVFNDASVTTTYGTDPYLGTLPREIAESHALDIGGLAQGGANEFNLVWGTFQDKDAMQKFADLWSRANYIFLPRADNHQTMAVIKVSQESDKPDEVRFSNVYIRYPDEILRHVERQFGSSDTDEE